MANIFVRISDVVSANINDLIDKVEDPERMIRQIIREMEENIMGAKESIVEAIAGEKQLAREVEHHRKQLANWQSKAEAALRAGKEELAREALSRKQDHERIANEVESSWKKAKETSRKLKNQLRAMEDKLAEARRKRGTLVARQRAAEARKYVDSTQNKFRRGLEVENRFVRMEGRVLQMEAEAEAIAELNDEEGSFDKEMESLEKEKEIESDLEALKEKIKNE
ncbi:MAG: PspA/IM30 family protein [Deltaproteobacteria bacterium]|nr:PspA/IM30 family protein [Deltaproteobacteria bacterium]